jgi:glycopeptide antibiotics resistance protein
MIKGLRSISILIRIIIVFSIFYFSWIPNPKLSETNILPSFISSWADTYYNLRTAIPFLFFQLFNYTKIAENNYNSALRKCLTTCFIIVLIAELGQTLIPNRNFDIEDILWGVFGGYIGYLLNFYFMNYEKDKFFK